MAPGLHAPDGSLSTQLGLYAALTVASWRHQSSQRFQLLGPVAPISVNFNHQLAYFADHSDTTHVRHQPTAVA